jgi:hypothetical protein
MVLKYVRVTHLRIGWKQKYKLELLLVLLNVICNLDVFLKLQEEGESMVVTKIQRIVQQWL